MEIKPLNDTIKEVYVPPFTPRQDLTTIIGILIPVAWTSSGEITCLAVATFDEKEYRLAAGEKVDQWQGRRGQMLSVQGVPYEKNGFQWFSVHSFQLIDAKIHNR